MSLRSAWKNIYFGWWVAIVCLLVSAVRAGVGFQTLGFIIRPMQHDLGWSATAIVACITAQHVFASLIGPLVGRLLDRFGGRTLIAFGAICDGVTLMIVSRVTEVWQFGLTMAILGGLAEACLGNGLIMPYISKWFVQRRGLAVGLVSIGTNLGGILVSPVIVSLTGSVGWRDAWLAVGFIPVLFIAPLAFFVLRSQPEALGIDPETALAPGAPHPVGEIEFTLKQAVATRSFWLLMLIWNLVYFATLGAVLDSVPYALEMGFTRPNAAGNVAAYGVAAIFGKLLVGLATERFGVRVVGVVLTCMQAIGLMAFIHAGSPQQMFISYGLLSGFSAGGLIALMPLVLANYFGRRHQGAISGITLPLLLASSVGGPLVAARIADVTGSYTPAFITFAVCAGCAALALLFLHRPPAPDEAKAGLPGRQTARATGGAADAAVGR